MRRIAKFLPILIAGLMLGACDDGSGPDTGRLIINLTDAPGDLDEAFVKIRQVILMGAEGDESAEGRLVLQPQATDYIDLLTLAGGNVLELVDASVPTGTYSELRIVIDEAYVRLTDGRVFATAGATLPAGTTSSGQLRCPSCSSSGFKVKFVDSGLNVEENAVVLIDFDVAQSFGHDAGQSGAWVMHPVLHATATTVHLGTIKGTVTLANGVALPACGGAASTLALFHPIAVMGTDTIAGATDELGAFRIAHLMPGAYTLGSLADVSFTNGDTLTFTAAPAPAAVNLPEGDSLTADYQVTAASCH